MKRWLLPVVLAVLILSVLPLAVKADNALPRIEVQPFPAEEIRGGEWLPVRLNLHNPGPTIDGYLSFQAGSQRVQQDTAVSIPVQLPTGSSLEYWIRVPAANYAKGNNRFVLTDGALDTGKSIAFAGGEVYLQTRLKQDLKTVIGVWANDPEAYRFLHRMSDIGHRIELYALDGEPFPPDSSWHGQFDVLAFNDFPSSQLDADIIDSIRTWVHHGGTLILSGGAGYVETAAAFHDLAPVQPDGTTELLSIPALEAAAGHELSLARPITLSDAEVTASGVVWMQENDIPLYAYRQVGSGEVWYVAYDVSLDPLAAWSGHIPVWESVLSDQPGAGNSESRRYYSGHEVESALEQFDELKSPPLGVMALLFFVYVIVVAPILYGVLKAWDKRGWAWLAIPGIAVAFSAAIYTTGAWERGDTLAKSLTWIELNGDGTAQQVSAASVFVPAGGKYEVGVPNGYRLSSYWSRFDSNINRELDGAVDERLIQMAGRGERIQFANVPYWSIRTFWVEDDTIGSDIGQLDIEYRRQKDAVEGEIINRTDVIWSDVHVLYKSEVQPLGDLAPNDQVTFRIPLASATANVHVRNIPHSVFPNYGEHVERRALLTHDLYQHGDDNGTEGLVVFGFSESEHDNWQIDGKPVFVSETVMWTQRVRPNYINGDTISIPYGEIKPVITHNDLQYMEDAGDAREGLAVIGQGELEFAYTLPVIPGARYDQLHLSYQTSEQLQIDIWNEHRESWERLEPGSQSITYTEPMPYIDNGRVRLRLNSLRANQSFSYPEIALEGVIDR